MKCCSAILHPETPRFFGRLHLFFLQKSQLYAFLLLHPDISYRLFFEFLLKNPKFFYFEESAKIGLYELVPGYYKLIFSKLDLIKYSLRNYISYEMDF